MSGEVYVHVFTSERVTSSIDCTMSSTIRMMRDVIYFLACCCIYGNQGKTKSPFTACGNKLTPVRPRISHFSMKIPRRPLFLLQPELLWPMLLFWVQLILLTEIWLVSEMSNIRIWYENRKPIYHRIQYYETRRKFTGIWNYRSISTFDFVLKYLFFFHKI